MSKRKTPWPGDPPPNAGKLSEEAQIFVVRSLALWVPQAEILKALAEQFPGEVCSQPGLWHYDPRNPRCPDRWRSMHKQIRDAFNERIADIATANPAYRVKLLDEWAHDLASKGSQVAAAGLLRQIAEDLGGSYTNRRDLTSLGEKIEAPSVPLGALSLETRRRIAEEMEAARSKDQPAE